MKLEEGQASRDEDRIRILNSIGQKEEQRLDEKPEVKKTLLGRVHVKFAQNEGHKTATKKARTLFSPSR